MKLNTRSAGLARTYLTATVATLLAFTTYIGAATAQSLDPNKPAPLQPGLNSSVADSFVGSHFYYFIAGPGNIKITVNFSSMGLFGNSTKTTIGVDVYDEKGKLIGHKNLTADSTSRQVVLQGTLDRKSKQTLRIQAPTKGLLREGGNYDVQVTGAVEYAPNTASSDTSSPDPIVKTYDLRTYVSGLFKAGAAKFYSDGTLKLADDNVGTWKLFDAEAKIYVIKIKGYIYNVKLRPGIGLVQTSDVNSIVFQEVN
jgi:hypothetical protein